MSAERLAELDVQMAAYAAIVCASAYQCYFALPSQDDFYRQAKVRGGSGAAGGWLSFQRSVLVSGDELNFHCGKFPQIV